MKQEIIEIRINEHPGVLSQITGLFARRNFALHGLIYNHDEEGETSAFLLIPELGDKERRQLFSRLKGLYDVIDLIERCDIDSEFFYPPASVCYDKDEKAVGM